MSRTRPFFPLLRAAFQQLRPGTQQDQDRDQTPLRSELFSLDQMDQHGRTLAAMHGLGQGRSRDRLLQRLDDNEQVLEATCALLTSAVRAKLRIAPAGEWLLDNYYLIEEQIRTARRHLPRDYSRELPRLAEGPSRDLPRVYDLALEAISHGDGRVDADSLGHFVGAYQTVTALTLGELWAIPIMLRLALIENLRRVGARLSSARLQVNQAQGWATQMMEMAERDPKSLILVIADMARSRPPMLGPFVAELARCLQGHGPALALPLTWIEQHLAESSLTIDQLVQSENQQQAADQVSISNTIGSLRFLGAMDWRSFVETLSCVEQVLREDPAGAYTQMDFATRDQYRHVIDRLGKHSPQSELQIARAAVQLAQAASVDPASGAPSAHVGYYLVDRGQHALEAAVQARLPLRARMRSATGTLPLWMYLGSVALLTGLLTLAMLAMADLGALPTAARILVVTVATIAASQLALALTHWLATLLVAPRRLPRMDYSGGLPPAMATLVVIPALLGDAGEIEDLLEALEVRYLGNRDPELHFGLLTDFRDARAESMDQDGPLLQQAMEGIARLNQRYGDSGQFYLFHRARQWNAAERCWMGHERKRGKLADLNALLRGAGSRRFAQIVGDTSALQAMRYVITLDTDTQLPRDSARQIVATMAHPLNRPRYDTTRTRLTGGYGILQPRVAPTLLASQRSHYAQLFGSEPGIDPYTRSVSDVYQDLFGEGSFIGKGIYDIDAFEAMLRDRLPDNRILSHDLLEGCHARSGLISDLSLFEDCPSTYAADVHRQRRWIRGDWQIARWLLPRVPGGDGRARRNTLSALSRWKILDNLRRSIVPLALVLLLVLGWTLLPHPWFWTLALTGVVLIPPLLASLVAALRKPGELRWFAHAGSVLLATRRHLALAAFRIACLPYEALYCLDAILRTAWRLGLTRRGLLEWRVSADDAVRDDARRVTRMGLAPGLSDSMWIAPFAALSTALGLALARPQALPAAAPILLLWLIAPLIADRLGRPRVQRAPQLDAGQRQFLRRIARKTWAFFERFAGPEDHGLVPDNFQEHPGPVTAHRTSPTNIGLGLLAPMAARDFGYLSAGAMLARTAAAFDTLAKLPRHQGHFYNWYDTLSLQPLTPRYVSSVDSGNLAGHLLTLRAGLLELPDQPVVHPRLFEGLADTLALMADRDGGSPSTLALQVRIDAALAQPPTTLAAVADALAALMDEARQRSERDPPEPGSEAALWAASFDAQCADAHADMIALVPWLGAPGSQQDPLSFGAVARIPTLRQIAADVDEPGLDGASDTSPRQALQAQGRARARARLAEIERLALAAAGFADMDYAFLYDRGRNLLAIGYNVDDYRRDSSFYDLLASEARQCSFVAIAQGKLPQESWFALSRLLTTVGGAPILVSWSGSMFEYLMPMLVMPHYAGTLLDQTCRVAVARQIAAGRQRGLPWGVSESGYNAVDANLNYQYHAFGVPGLGLMRGLAEDSVIAPYASALALMVAPEAACVNLQLLSGMGLEGRYGFHEAVDYTPSRLPRGETSVIVRSYMAHHQGMSLLALASLMLDQPMQRRFASDPALQATLLLLQERIPRHAPIQAQRSDPSEGSGFSEAPADTAPLPYDAQTAAPEVQLLSNGRYQLMVTNAGGGYSRWKDLAVTRWREDATRDHWGSFLYVRDVDSGEFWSATYQPTLRRADSYEAMFSQGRAEYRRRDLDCETYSEIVLSPEDDIELRRLRLTNRSRTRRTLDVTSYAEVVLRAPAADLMQSAFGKLFVQTEIVPGRRALLCTRRPRSSGEPTPWMCHLLAANGTRLDSLSYETDRLRFIGRGRSLVSPQAMADRGALSGSQGSVLDPIVSIRCQVTLDPEQSVTLDWVTGAADSREACMALVDKYQDRHLADRAFDLAWTHSGVTLRQINATEADAQLYRRLAGLVIYANAALRAEPAVLIQNRRGQSGLWGYAISGDLPIVLLKVSDSAHIELARQMIQCHAYWRLKGLAVDLVIWNEDHPGYRQRLQDQIMGLVATGLESHAIDRPGGIFVRSAEQISSEDRVLLQAVARVVISDRQGTLAEQVTRRSLAPPRVPRLEPTRRVRSERSTEPAALPAAAMLDNGHGGLSADGTEYQVRSSGALRTPLPWVNVLANPGFGTVVTESGQAYTWSENAHEFRLTPWSEDPVDASGGEAYYLRDEDSGECWSPAPQPCGGAEPYLTRHGFGYSVFEHRRGGIESELWVYVDLEESIKFSVLKVRNLSGRARRLSATGYVEWVLGDLRPKSAMHVVTEIDPGSGALLARNAYNTAFEGRVAFFDVDDLARTLSGDRNEFLGRNGAHSAPDALRRARLSGRVGAALDPCGAIQVPFDLADGQSREVIFRLGVGLDLEQARQRVQRFRRSGSARRALDRVRDFWRQTLGAVQVRTPDPALDALANGWLVYQTLACRMWARSGFYQSGGAYGFRDQLQDSMALVHTQPGVLREHLLRCATRQYPEGDVQHWWHPPAGRGVRTRCSDDYLWLPLAICRYVDATDDRAVLDETLSFLDGRALNADEESYYDLPQRSTQSASLYQHGVRAVLHGLRFGERGLPLMGSGDWNDGMNLVGIHGRGESVWLGFFLHQVLLRFARLAEAHADPDFAERCTREAAQLARNLEGEAWDGAWYRRAWFDDGTPLGSSYNLECRIDSISQSWSVLSGVADPDRARSAMDALDHHLVRRGVDGGPGLVQLLDPPFDTSALDPGYIKGYVPGVRENGGQYTHAAIWAAMAYAQLGDAKRAWELLDLINPVNHGRSAQEVAVYKAEPYVVAADVYGVAPHTGRGGWTWYTGSAGWLYRLILESLLGLNLEAQRLRFAPCIPAHWRGFSLRYRYRRATYEIEVTQAVAMVGPPVLELSLDGVLQPGASLVLVDEPVSHSVVLRLQPGQESAPLPLAA